MNLINNFKGFLEIKAFGVCTYIGDKLGIATSKIRLFFIYITFLTFGSPVFVYLAMAFLLNLRNYITFRRRKKFWDF